MLQARLQKVEDAWLHERSIDHTTYQTQRDHLRHDLDDIEAELPASETDDAEIDSVLSFATSVLGNTTDLWKKSALTERQCLQQVLFPNGLEFDGRQFGNVETCLVFSLLAAEGSEKPRMASPTGFEPVSWP